MRSPMNAIAAVILAFLLLEFMLRLAADVLNLGSLRDEVPEAFRDSYEPGRYRKAQAYLRARTRFGWCSGAVFARGNARFLVRRRVRLGRPPCRALGLGPVPSGLVYVGAIALLRAALSLPFRVYSVFVIESRSGFNTTGWKTFSWTASRPRSCRLPSVGRSSLRCSTCLEQPVRFPGFTVEVAFSLLMLCMQFIAPRWILPLFTARTRRCRRGAPIRH
ncbi:MAG: hypothetical protein MZV70_08290 [Desulfobacterales bacterium]|nr:hypothetical protein [Desulfobacterales bacterium]